MAAMIIWMIRVVTAFVLMAVLVEVYCWFCGRGR